MHPFTLTLLFICILSLLAEQEPTHFYFPACAIQTHSPVTVVVANIVLVVVVLVVVKLVQLICPSVVP